MYFYSCDLNEAIFETVCYFLSRVPGDAFGHLVHIASDFDALEIVVYVFPIEIVDYLFFFGLECRLGLLLGVVTVAGLFAEEESFV